MIMMSQSMTIMESLAIFEFDEYRFELSYQEELVF